MELNSRNRLLESRVIRKSVKRGSERGGWKRAEHFSTSLAAYSTHVRFEVAGDGNQDKVNASEALSKETESNWSALPKSQAPSLDPTSRPPTRVANSGTWLVCHRLWVGVPGL